MSEESLQRDSSRVLLSHVILLLLFMWCYAIFGEFRILIPRNFFTQSKNFFVSQFFGFICEVEMKIKLENKFSINAGDDSSHFLLSGSICSSGLMGKIIAAKKLFIILKTRASSVKVLNNWTPDNDVIIEYLSINLNIIQSDKWRTFWRTPTRVFLSIFSF